MSFSRVRTVDEPPILRALEALPADPLGAPAGPRCVVFRKGLHNLNIIAIRSPRGAPNRFDDELVIVYRVREESGREAWCTVTMACTTDPGAYYAKNPMNVDGTATLCPGQYRGGWKAGLHRNEYPALVQNKPVRVWRDRDRDGQPDEAGPVATGMFGINIHRASANRRSDTVDRWSAGCIVVADPADFRELMKLVGVSLRSYGEVFTATLVDRAALEAVCPR